MEQPDREEKPYLIFCKHGVKVLCEELGAARSCTCVCVCVLLWTGIAIVGCRARCFTSVAVEHSVK